MFFFWLASQSFIACSAISGVHGPHEWVVRCSSHMKLERAPYLTGARYVRGCVCIGPTALQPCSSSKGLVSCVLDTVNSKHPERDDWKRLVGVAGTYYMDGP